VVVLDLSLPGIDGYALARALRAHPATAHIPIVVLSAHAYPENEQRAREAGASAFLRKPCLPAELAETLKRVSGNCQRAFTSIESGPQAAAL
jgi:CheY-like chemotaxis protein